MEPGRPAMRRPRLQLRRAQAAFSRNMRFWALETMQVVRAARRTTTL